MQIGFGAGAGGNWPVINETSADARVVAQEDGLYCGCACALMVLNLLGLTEVPSQHELWEANGAMPYTVDGLAVVLNETIAAHQVGEWRGGTVDVAVGSEATVLRALGSYFPWIAHVRQGPGVIGHLVVVVEVTATSVHILDPWMPGTCYQMTLADFIRIWNLQAVYLVGGRA